MARILIAWEFGAGLGHLTRLLPIAEALGRHGHRLAFALQNLGAARAVGLTDRLLSMDYSIRRGPIWPVFHGTILTPRHTLADTLKMYGYDDVPRLLAAVRSWRQIVDETNPDLVIADCSPTLRLAIGDRCPLLSVGNGYSVPPPGRALPPICPWEQGSPPARAESEAEVHRAVLAVSRSLAVPAADYVSDLFSGTTTFVCTIPEFDPYGAYRVGPTFDSYNLPVISGLPPAELRPENHMFLYLPGHHPALPIILSAARAMGLQGSAYVPKLSPSVRARFSGPGLTFWDRPPPFSETLRDARLLIHQGGLSTTYAGLASGTPQLIMPQYLENLVNAEGAAKFGSAVVLAPLRRPDQAVITSMLEDLTCNSLFRQKARDAAAQIGDRRKSETLASILAACHDLLAG